MELQLKSEELVCASVTLRQSPASSYSKTEAATACGDAILSIDIYEAFDEVCIGRAYFNNSLSGDMYVIEYGVLDVVLYNIMQYSQTCSSLYLLLFYIEYSELYSRLHFVYMLF